jgi:nitric oxide reductase NorD protein
MTNPQTATALEAHLTVLLAPVLSFRRSAAEAARRLACLSATEQDFVWHWLAILAANHAELAYQFAHYAHESMGFLTGESMSQDSPYAVVEDWLIQVVDHYDRDGLSAAIRLLQQPERFADTVRVKKTAVCLAEFEPMLRLYLQGLSGRPLQLAILEEQDPSLAWTDTQTLYVPEMVSLFSQKNDNFLLYKALLTHLWAQLRFSSYPPNLSAQISVYPNQNQAARAFNALERLRLDACVRRELPGLWRDMVYLQQQQGQFHLSPVWQMFAQRLEDPLANVDESLALLPQALGEELPLCCYQGTMRLEQMTEIRAQRINHEAQLLRQLLVELPSSLRDLENDEESSGDVWKALVEQPSLTDSSVRLERDGVVVEVPDRLNSVMQSIVQDFGGIPEGYLPDGSSGESVTVQLGEEKDEDTEANASDSGVYHYDEWDFERGHYRKSWCVLREKDCSAGDPLFIQDTLQKHSGLIKMIRRRFECLRGENSRLKRQFDGDDLDMEAFVDAWIDSRNGDELDTRVYTQQKRVARNIAVVFMVDMSGSTKGWINTAERESLVLLCEALESLGDRYAIYGFSGRTRKRCDLYRIKHFDEGYSQGVKNRISGIKPKEYTRMGVAIRHLSHVLGQVDAGVRLLITLSDGKPEDGDIYKGQYGIEDSRQALFEARRAGIHSFCITIDKDAEDYLPYLYGAANYVVIDDVRQLPVRLTDIYRRLTH